MSDYSYYEEFNRAVEDLAKELSIKPKIVSIENRTVGNKDFSFYAGGGSEIYFFEYFARRMNKGEGIDVMINISESSPPEDKMVSFREEDYRFVSFERITGGAIHQFNLDKHRVDLRILFNTADSNHKIYRTRSGPLFHSRYS